MPKKVITVPNAPRLPFSPATVAGDYIFVSGQTGSIDSNGKEVTGIDTQTRQCLENIKLVLEAAGSSLNKVVKVTIFLTRVGYFPQMNKIYQSYFPKDYPARSTVVTGLAAPSALVEIECIAYSK